MNKTIDIHASRSAERVDWQTVWQQAAPIRPLLAQALLWSGLIGLFMLSPSIYMLQVYDRVMASGNQLTLLAVSLIALISLLAVAWLESARSTSLLQVSQRLDAAYRGRAVLAAFVASLDPGARDSASRVLPDIEKLRRFLCGPGLIAWFEAPWVPLYIVVLYLLHPWLAGFASILVVTQAAFTLATARFQGEVQTQATEAQQREMALAGAAMRSAESAAAMGMQRALSRHWLDRRQVQQQLALKASERVQLVTGASQYLRQVQQSLMLGLAAWLVVKGELTAGSIVAANMLCSRALGPIDALLSQWQGTVEARDALRRLESIKARAVSPTAVVGPVQRPLAHSGLELSDVNAFAPTRKEPILNGVNLVLRDGSVTALVGNSGAGKSTLARVVAGTWPSMQGLVTLDGLPSGSPHTKDGAWSVGYLPQEIQLFDGSVAENIARLQRPNPADVIEAATRVGLHEAILRLPKGYDTPLFDSKLPLNAGLLQRIGLARAIYGRPRLLVLDEPDAHLDEEGERALRTLLTELKATGRIALVVTHRPGLLAACDHIVHLDEGRLRLASPGRVASAPLGRHAVAPI